MKSDKGKTPLIVLRCADNRQLFEGTGKGNGKAMKYAIYEGNIDRLEKKLKRISNKCKAYGCDFHYEQTGEEFRELKDEKGNKYTARFVLVEAEGTAIINDWEFIAELEHTENGNIITGVAGVEVPERYYTTRPMCEHCNSTTIKLIGKLLREKITIEGLFTIVLRTGVNEGKYYFYTQNSGKDTVKSPMGMFPAYAIDNDLNYVADKIRNFYEVGEYKTDAEMGQADAQAASDLEKPDANGRRARGGKKTTATATATPPTTTEDAAPKTGRTARKTHDEVVAENNQKMADYMAERDKAIDAVADGREEIPFDEACAAADSVPQPELETPPRRTRKERKSAEQSEPVQDGTANTNSESVTLDADTYFYVPADDNYVMKHKGDTVDLIVDGVEVMKVISKEEFGEGVKRLAQADNPKPENPIDGAMNPPEKGRRTRRSAAQAQPDNADTTADETPAVDEQPTGRTRRVRKTR